MDQMTIEELQAEGRLLTDELKVRILGGFPMQRYAGLSNDEVRERWNANTKRQAEMILAGISKP